MINIPNALPQNIKTKTYSNSLFLGTYQYSNGINSEFNINWCHWVPDDLPTCYNPKMKINFVSGSGSYAFHHISSAFNEQCASLTFDQKQSLNYKNYSMTTSEEFVIPNFQFMTTGRFLPVNCLYIKSDNAPSSITIITECDCITNGCPNIICNQQSLTQAPTVTPGVLQPTPAPTSQDPTTNVNSSLPLLPGWLVIALVLMNQLLH